MVAKIKEKKEFNPKFKSLVERKLTDCLELVLSPARALEQAQSKIFWFVEFKDKRYDKMNKLHEEYLNKVG